MKSSSEPVATTVSPSRVRATDSSRSSAIRTPARSHFSTIATCHSDSGPSNHSRTAAAIVGPTPSVSASSASSASRIAVIEPNRVASARAAVGPTWRIESATTTRQQRDVLGAVEQAEQSLPVGREHPAVGGPLGLVLLRGAGEQLGGQQPLLVASTKPDGTYDVGGLRAGTYRIGFRPHSQGLAAEYWDNAPTLSSAQDVVVLDGARVAGKDAELAEAGHIAGTVTDQGGAPIDNVGVTAYAWSEVDGEWVEDEWASTDETGAYVLDGLPAGTYLLGFRSDDGDHAFEYWDDAATLESAAGIVVASGATVEGRNAQLAPAAHVTGTVAADRSTASVTVAAYSKGANGWRAVSWAGVQEDGTYDLGGLRSGTYRIGFEDYADGLAPEYWNDKPTVELADDVVVSAGGTTVGKDATLQPVAREAYANTVAPTIAGTPQVGQQRRPSRAPGRLPVRRSPTSGSRTELLSQVPRGRRCSWAPSCRASGSASG